MPSLIQKRFTNPETFRKIRPDLLWAWLKPYESYFKERGLVLPTSGENLGAFNASKMQAIADQLGLDRTKFDACVASGTEQAAVKAQTKDGVAKGIDSTPTLYLNGTKYVGAMPYSQLAPLIDAAYAAATGSPSPSTSPSAGASGASPSP